MDLWNFFPSCSKCLDNPNKSYYASCIINKKGHFFQHICDFKRWKKEKHWTIIFTGCLESLVSKLMNQIGNLKIFLTISFKITYSVFPKASLLNCANIRYLIGISGYIFVCPFMDAFLLMYWYLWVIMACFFSKQQNNLNGIMICQKPLYIVV